MQTAQVIPFNFESREIRTLLIDDEPWFCAKDVCAVLGYANDSDAIKKHCREKGVAKRDSLTSGGKQSLTFINEGNLYRLIIKSRKPEAQRFESWVCDEVLPTIRKHGRYEDTSGRMDTLLNSTIGTDGFHCLAAVLDGKLRHLPTKARQRAKMHVWSQVHKAFSVVSAEDIPATQLDSARNFIAAYNVHEGEFLGKEPEPKDEDSLTLSGNEVTSLYKLMSHYSNACDLIKHMSLSGVAKLLESKPLFNLCDQVSEAGFGFAQLDKRRNEIYDIYKRRVSSGGYAMSKEGLPPR